MDFTRKPADIQNEPTCAKCYQIVIKRGERTPQTRINTRILSDCNLFPLQTDSNGYKQKSLILRHFQKKLELINHYKKEK